MERESEPAVFMQYVSGDEAVRDSAVEGEKKLQVSRGSASSREGYGVLRGSSPSGIRPLSPYQQRPISSSP